MDGSGEFRGWMPAPLASRQFVAFGDVWMKLNQIKSYGITEGADASRCLYVTTHRGNCYRFYVQDVRFDLAEKCRELDAMLR